MGNGSRPLHRIIYRLSEHLSWFFYAVSLFAVLIGLLSPTVGHAASLRYLEENAPGFIDKTRNAYGEMVNIAALLQDYDENLVLAVIVVESEGREGATSHRGAQGLMQLMPLTAKSLGVKDSKEPFQNILAGTKYLKQLEDRYGFDSPQEALVAYNMGPSRAKRWLSQYSPSEYGYVQKVMYVYGLLQEEERSGGGVAYTSSNTFRQVARLSSLPATTMTRPRVLSMSALPPLFSTTRRSETITEE